MADEEPESLWLFGEPEPWRRGRVAIALITATVLLGHAAAAVVSLMKGDVGQFLLTAVAGCSGAFLLFLIWIGQNWARWIIAPFFALLGSCCVVWGILFGGIGALFLIGIGALVIFCYLTLSPSVYAFARHQRERASLRETLVVGATFALLLGSIGSGLLAFHLYENSLEREAVEFAQLTFRRVFVNRDPHFLEDHASATRKYSRPQEFINLIDAQLGETTGVGPFAARLTSRLEGHSLRLAGTVTTRALFTTGGVWVKIQISGTERAWKVEHVSWDY